MGLAVRQTNRVRRSRVASLAVNLPSMRAKATAGCASTESSMSESDTLLMSDDLLRIYPQRHRIPGGARESPAAVTTVQMHTDD